jgi:ubiquinone/menaquinone biosynthesis C-methylase UbiE
MDDPRRPMRTLSHQEARRVYDRIGARQDTQAFYEDVATRELIRHGEFGSADAVFEFGCGTGRFARMLLDDHLGPTATYRGVDLSPTMAGLAERRLSEFAGRARVVLTDGGPPAAEPAESFDRFVSNFVFDLLSEADIAAVLSEAHRMLRPGGLLCLASLSPGHGLVSRAVIRVWSFLHRLDPRLVAGCRPVELLPFLEAGHWKVRYHRPLAPYGLPSEAVVAERLPAA